MAAFVRIVIFGFAFLTAVYVIAFLWSRSVRAGRLRKEWRDSGGIGDMETYVRQGLERQDGQVRRRLVVLVYVIPVAVMVAVIYISNFL
ncbi:hypothetical protein DQW77_04220 [Roseovarius sp. TE539]|uniref:hypothetical protein n=1 Tax=Roseovarius sp. TE539 TaxID=2249812 RepID=UPI000DE00E71|nr:hypothetical protein [Roseovarius sp. TE539]RBI76102.1 hypothetical protein DQW77_04220 [Roseovarius sp. TE539]